MTIIPRRRAAVAICLRDAEAGIILEHEIVSEHGQAEVKALLVQLQERARVEADKPVMMAQVLSDIGVPDGDSDEVAELLCDDLNEETEHYISWRDTPFAKRQFSELLDHYCPDGRYAGSTLEQVVLRNRLVPDPDFGLIADTATRLGRSVGDQANPIVVRELAAAFHALAYAVREAADLPDEQVAA